MNDHVSIITRASAEEPAPTPMEELIKQMKLMRIELAAHTDAMDALREAVLEIPMSEELRKNILAGEVRS